MRLDERLLRLPGARRAVAAAERLRALEPVQVVELTVRRFLADGMVDRAASLAYYGLLSLLPTLMIGAGVVSLLGGDTTGIELAEYLRDEGASATLADTVESVVKTAVDSAPSTAGTVGLVGLVTLIYGASRAFVAAGRALDVIWRRGRPGRTVVRRITGIGWTVLLIVLGMAAGLLTFVGRGLAEDVLDLVGLEEADTLVWALLRWPLAGLLMMLTMRLVMWASPSPPRDPFRLVTPGALAAAGLWLVASAGYGFYVGELATYNATYGAFAALVILLLWIWLTSMAFLFGCELDAVIVSRRERRGQSPPPAGAPAPPPPAPAAPPPARTRAEDR